MQEDRKCGPSCCCQFCKNIKKFKKETCTSERDLVIQGLLEEHSDNTYVEESDDEDLEHLRNEEMDNDEDGCRRGSRGSSLGSDEPPF